MSDSELVERTGLRSIVSQPTKGYSKLDRVHVSDLDGGAENARVDNVGVDKSAR